MTKFFHHSLLIALGVGAVALVPACSSSSGDDDSSSGGTSGTGGSGNGTGGTMSSGTMNVCETPPGNTMLIPSSTGWIDHADLCNDVNVQGAWYPYGDQYGTGNGAKKCLTYGNHMSSECATITSPDPTMMAFTNTNGEMHTEGTAEKVLPCVAGSMAATIPTSGCTGAGMAGGNDYSSMWGAGIGFDLNADGGDSGMKHTWDPAAVGVVGIQFTIDQVPLGGLRVEFPMQLLATEAAMDTPPVTTMPPTTDDHSSGAPYWGAQRLGDAKYPSSPVVAGVNTVLFATDVQVPKLGAYVWDPSRMLGIQFHVPTSTSSSSTYSFTISKVTFLRTAP